MTENYLSSKHETKIGVTNFLLKIELVDVFATRTFWPFYGSDTILRRYILLSRKKPEHYREGGGGMARIRAWAGAGGKTKAGGRSGGITTGFL